MLLKKDLMNSMDSLYGDMLKEVNIPDFTKCIAQFAGMRIQDVKDEVIRDYLITWAENKYQFYKLLGNKLKLDMPIIYKNYKTDSCSEFELLKKEFPGFAPWLGEFSNIKQNKVENYGQVGYYGKGWLRDLFPDYQITGNTLTGFFKRKLNAPDELITAIGRIFENETIEGTYTISIDPVDMMLASENPYKWQSCYRLETPNDASHADGCLAAVLDKSSLITYIWDKEGKFNLYDHELKSVRYKRIREWLAIAPDMKAIHFNQIYPGKDAYPDEFRKQLRDKVETLVAEYLEMPNIWAKTTDTWCSREVYYGYGEFDSFNIWKIKGSDEQQWDVYDTNIKCPCGCGMVLPGSDDQEGYYYTGDGFICENFRYEDEEDRPYCSIADDYCCYADDICDCNCRGCRYYDDEYPLCNLDDTTECENVDVELVDNGRMQSCEGHCEGCPLWAQHHPAEAATAAQPETENAYEAFKMVVQEAQATQGNQGYQTLVIDSSSGIWDAYANNVNLDSIQNLTINTDTNYFTVSTDDIRGDITYDRIRDAAAQYSNPPSQSVLDIHPHMIIREAGKNGVGEIIFGRFDEEE